ncbi:MAG: hypothetical protein IJA57_04985 [Alistipes sp.]|nr:hypothetical protein [Alistipes sp.]
MRYDIRRAARQYLALLVILLSSLLLVTCLGSDDSSPDTRDYESYRTSTTSPSQSEGRAE